MTHRVLLRAEVPNDLHSIVVWLDRHSSSAGDRFMDAVFSALDGLAQMPGKGSPKTFRSRRLSGIRSWSVPGFKKFLIFYRIHSQAIEVLAVVHGSREIRALLKKRVPPE